MDLLRFYYTQNPTPMEDEDLFDAYNVLAVFGLIKVYEMFEGRLLLWDVELTTTPVEVL